MVLLFYKHNENLNKPSQEVISYYISWKSLQELLKKCDGLRSVNIEKFCQEPKNKML